MISVIIATDNRAGALKECLGGLNRQTSLPGEVIVAHGGSDRATEGLVKDFAAPENCKIKVVYYDFGPLGAARQRNEAAKKAAGEILLFLDDDVVCEPDFVKEIASAFEKDPSGEIGGVSGIMTNQFYVPLGRVNKLLFDLSLARRERNADYAGRVVGPAVNFLPADKPDTEQEVDWLYTTCSAYRRDVFLEYGFNENFKGYSFMEDVELSARVKKRFKLVNTTKARCLHRDLGGKTHRDWVEIGKRQVVNRWHVMVDVLGRNTPADKIRFFYYQLYCVFGEARTLIGWPSAKHTLSRWLGRFLGYFLLWKRLS